MIRRCLRRSTQGPLQEDVANRRKPERASINPQNQTLSGWGVSLANTEVRVLGRDDVTPGHNNKARTGDGDSQGPPYRVWHRLIHQLRGQ